MLRLLTDNYTIFKTALSRFSTLPITRERSQACGRGAEDLLKCKSASESGEEKAVRDFGCGERSYWCQTGSQTAHRLGFSRHHNHLQGFQRMEREKKLLFFFSFEVAGPCKTNPRQSKEPMCVRSSLWLLLLFCFRAEVFPTCVNSLQRVELIQNITLRRFFLVLSWIRV